MRHKEIRGYSGWIQPVDGDSRTEWLSRARIQILDDPKALGRLSSGQLSKVIDPKTRQAFFRAEEDLLLRIAWPSPSCVRVALDLKLHSPSQVATVEWPGGVAQISGSPEDSAALNASLRLNGRNTSLSLRFRPDVARWASNEGERERYKMEFESLAGWPSSWIRVAVDILADEVRIWLQGRFVAAGKKPPEMAEFSLGFSEGTVFKSISIFPLGPSRYLPLDIVPYANCKAFAPGDLGDGFAFPEPLSSVRGMIEVEGIPFQVELGNPRGDNIDLGQTEYRGRAPYIHCDALSGDPVRTLLRVPSAHYHRLHLICVSDTTEGDLPVASVRMIITGKGHASTFEFTAPRWDEASANAHELPVGNTIHAGHASGGAGKLWLVTVPLNVGELPEYLREDGDYIEMDLTRKVSLDDDAFPRPTGPRTSVHIFAATLELSPAKMLLEWDGAAPLYEDPAVARLKVSLESQREDRQEISLRLAATDPYGWGQEIVEHTMLEPHQRLRIIKEFARRAFGKYELHVSLQCPGEGSFVEHRTSFAYLPADNRRATTDSPFGMWCFFEVHDGLPPNLAAPLMRMAGARWTLPAFLLTRGEEENANRIAELKRNKIRLNCGHVCCIGNSCCETPNDPVKMIEKMTKMPSMNAWMVFWETYLSPRHRNSFPQELLGKPPLELTQEEKRHLENCWTAGTSYSELVRKRFPSAKLVFGNGFPPFIGAMMKRGYPKRFLDAFGLDFDLFTSMPERQPGPLYAPFSGIYILKALQKAYGYAEFPLYLTEAIYAPVAPGWLTERHQADHYVRAHLLALASGVVFFGMCTSLYDPGDDYFYSHYGPIGLLHRPPMLNPRESFCAYSTMTRVLDQARFDGLLEMGSTSVFGLKFSRRRRGPVFGFWTIRGKRLVTIACKRMGRPRLTDMFGNTRRPVVAGDRIRFELTSSPVYLEGVDGLTDITLGDPVHESGGGADAMLVADFADPSDWKLGSGPVDELERLSLSVPYRWTRLELSWVRRFDGRGPLLRVCPPRESKHHPLEILYCELTWQGPSVRITDSASAIGAWMHGNSSWGRVIYVLEDAGGARLVSLRAESYIDFDGWRYVTVPLPHGPHGKNVERTGFEPWVRSSVQDPEYPLSLIGIILEARSHVIYADELRRPPSRFYYVDRIVVDGQ